MLPNSTVKKVLIYRLGSLGDTTVALPCFHLIERAFPASERVLLTNFPVHAKAPASAAVLGDSGLGAWVYALLRGNAECARAVAAGDGDSPVQAGCAGVPDAGPVDAGCSTRQVVFQVGGGRGPDCWSANAGSAGSGCRIRLRGLYEAEAARLARTVKVHLAMLAWGRWRIGI